MRASGGMWPFGAAKVTEAAVPRSATESPAAGAPDSSEPRRFSAPSVGGRAELTRAEAMGGSALVAAILDALCSECPTAGRSHEVVTGREVSVFLAGGRQAIVGTHRHSDERRRSREAIAYAIEEVLGGRSTIISAARDLGLHTNSVTRYKNVFIFGGRVALERELWPLT